MDSLISQITPLILTFNEAPNIRRTLERLTWARQIVVVDSFSTDETLGIVREFPQVRVVQQKFISFADQCNFGLKHIDTEWVLSLDADYVLTPELVEELRGLSPRDELAGYEVKFHYCVFGRRLRTCLYPPRTVLYQRSKAQYYNDGHGHRVKVQGKLAMLAGGIDHDDRKSLSHWVVSQDRYAIQEATKLAGTPAGELSLQDKLRCKMIFAPPVVFFYCLFAKRLILDGWPGWYYVFQRAFAEILLSLRLLEEKFKK